MRKALQLFTMLTLLLFGGGGLWAQTTVTFTAGTDKGTNTQASSADRVSKDGITIDVTTGAFNAAQFRFAKGSTATFTSTVGNITKVEFTCTASGTTKYGPGCFTDPSTGTYTYDGKTGTWEGNAASFTLTASKNQVRATQIVFTITSSDKKAAGLAYETTTYTVYLGDDFTAPELQNPNNLTGITYASSNEEVATVDASTGAVTLGKTTGTAKITASYAGDDIYAYGEASYTITLLKHLTLTGDGTEENPYTVADVNDMLGNNQTPTDEVYVKGIVSEVGNLNSTYGELTYYISDDGTTTNQLEIYNGLFLNGEKFTSQDQLSTGDEVVVQGKLQVFNGANEMTYGSKIVKITKSEKLDAGLSFPATAYEATLGTAFDAPTLNNTNNLSPITYTSSTTDVATVDESTGAVTLVAKGTTTITASFSGNDIYKAGSASYTLTVSPRTPIISTLPWTDATASQFTVNDVTLPDGMTSVWTDGSYNGDSFKKGSGYYNRANHAAEGWLISPIFNLSSYTSGNITFAFDQAINAYFGTISDEATLWVKEDGGEWTQTTITYPEKPSKGYSDFKTQTVDLTAYQGKSIQIAFKYTSTADAAGTWEIKNINLTNVTETPKTDPALAYATSEVSVNVNETVTNPLTNEHNVPVTYSSNNTAIATVNETTGEVTGVAEGSTTITATFAGDETYSASTASYTINVVDPNANTKTATFIFNDAAEIEALGITVPTTSGNGTNLDPDAVYQKEEVSMTVKFGSGKTHTRIWNGSGKYDLRVYSGDALTFSVPAGYTLKSIQFDCNGKNYTYNDWTSDEAYEPSHTITPTKQVRFNTITVTYAPVPLTSVTLSDAATANNVVGGYSNVTLTRSFAANAWNTLVLPFDLSADQVKEVFGEGVRMANLKNTSADSNGDVTLHFSETDAIKANVPVLVYGAADATAKLIEKVSVLPTATPATTADACSLVGSYDQATLEVGDWFLSTDNKLYKATTTKTIKPLRAVFRPTSSEAKSLRLDIDGDVTAIDAITGEPVIDANAPLYNLAGQRVGKAYKGVVVQNGRKFINK